MNKDRWAAALATVAVIAAIILGLRMLGGPGKQRLQQSDLRTVQMLGNLAQQIQADWVGSGKVLPASLDKFPRVATRNPVTGKPFAYHPKSNSAYELCATFVTDNQNLQPQNPTDRWTHPRGDYCFQLDASQMAPPAPFDY